MSKNSILILSILSLISAIIYNVLPGKPYLNVLTGKTIALVVVLIFWIIVIYSVFSDTKQRNKSTIFVGLTLLLGGIGGLIYYFTIFKESDEQLATKTQQGMSESSRKNLFIFSIILTLIFGFAFIMTLPLRGGSSFNWPLTITLGVILLACIVSIFYANNNN